MIPIQDKQHSLPHLRVPHKSRVVQTVTLIIHVILHKPVPNSSPTDRLLRLPRHHTLIPFPFILKTTYFCPWLMQIIPEIPGSHSCVPLFVTNFHRDHTYSPWVILNDFGGAFAMGAVGGGIWHGIKGARNSPRVRAPPRPSLPQIGA